jgi:RNA-binding protein
MDSATRKKLRRIAHHLQPVIIIGDGGLSDGLVAETERALADHELIKVKINALDREQRIALGDALAETCKAQPVQRIGKVLVLYRKNAQPNPALSNLVRTGIG